MDERKSKVIMEARQNELEEEAEQDCDVLNVLRSWLPERGKVYSKWNPSRKIEVSLENS